MFVPCDHVHCGKKHSLSIIRPATMMFSSAVFASHRLRVEVDNRPVKVQLASLQWTSYLGVADLAQKMMDVCEMRKTRKRRAKPIALEGAAAAAGPGDDDDDDGDDGGADPPCG